MKKRVKKLFLLQLREKGIGRKAFGSLKKEERKLLLRKKNRYYLKKGARGEIRVVLTGGVFDILHIGHLFTLEKAKKLGDLLVVVVACDRTVKREKRKPIHGERYRRRMVNALKPVDIALIGGERKELVLKRVSPDVVAFGFDQKPFVRPGPYKIVRFKERLKDKVYKTNKIIIRLGI
jgi:cytidyltransferase-like protein